ncbi:helix-turn-helix domain-containing protein [Aquihabitans daechungensis]|uniref:helix-turn-helix domain-containing protein n=1 Tax=Aquihabitans daechungensis TaxID=1052257 RepID=UPI003BA24A39
MPPTRAERAKGPKDPELVLIGRHLRVLRLERSLTQESLADAAGLHWTYIGQIERGERNLTVKNVLRLERGLGIGPGDLTRGAFDGVTQPSTG